MTPPPVPSKSALLGALLHFAVASVGMMLGNKLAVTALPLPCTVIIIQALGTIALLGLFRSNLEGIRIDIAKQWLPIAALFTLMIFTSLQSFVYVNVSTVLIFRNVGAIFTSIVEYFVRGEKVTAEIVASEIMIVLGAVMYGWGTANFSWTGFWWIMANIAAQVAYGVLVKHHMDKKPHFKEMSKFTMSLYNNTLAIPMLVIVLVVQGEQHHIQSALVQVSPLGWFWIVLTCGLGFMISTSGFGLQKLVSATTFLVVSNITKFLNILLGIVFLQDNISAGKDGLGCLVAILAGVWYSSAQTRIAQQGKKNK
ncbi:GDP-mannose transporter, putative [Bodo saltans]|uniref:GDP-mannose transporter, putative n=1 Tax=Bodo saltans TaxID=75058 RepID=A0A0S4J6I5_BODSA|nr:GDP-mannose transporter, putative [Bodo saltans]|eukprot:CUG87028.1 GDP-mannose transporter, putative [Bodo saltans]